MTNNVALTFSVGDTTLRFTISIEQDKLELVTLNIILSVVRYADSSHAINDLCRHHWHGDRDRGNQVYSHWFLRGAHNQRAPAELEGQACCRAYGGRQWFPQRTHPRYEKRVLEPHSLSQTASKEPLPWKQEICNHVSPCDLLDCWRDDMELNLGRDVPK